MKKTSCGFLMGDESQPVGVLIFNKDSIMLDKHYVSTT